MHREEAEAEADRRNSEDERRKRLEFYAFDETAGMDADGWTVAVRLRRSPPPEPATPAGAAAAAAAVSEPGPPEPQVPDPEPEPEPEPTPEPEPADEGEPDDPQATQAYDVVAHEFEDDKAPTVPPPADPPTQVAPPPAPVAAAAAPEPPDEPEDGDGDEDYPEYEDAYYNEAFPEVPYDEYEQPGMFVRTIGTVVLVVGWLWLLMLVALAVVIRPDVPTAVALYAVGFVAGLCVLWLGVAIRRS